MDEFEITKDLVTFLALEGLICDTYNQIISIEDPNDRRLDFLRVIYDVAKETYDNILRRFPEYEKIIEYGNSIEDFDEAT